MARRYQEPGPVAGPCRRRRRRYPRGMVDLLALAQGQDPLADAPSPDELLLELMDLLALSFPTVVHRTTVAFVPTEDGRRPALADLDARAAKDATPRPPLGHTDVEVLDTINHLLGEFADATARQGGVRALRGRLEFVDTPDQGRDVRLVEVDAEGAETLGMTRTFDASELRWLYYTPALFAALNGTADEEQAQGTRLEAALAGTTRFDIDMKTARISFSGGAGEPPTYRFELVGSWLEESGRFMWGWANDQVGPSMTRRIEEIRRSSTGPGLRAFTDASLGGPPALFSRLARHVGARIGAFGVYRAPFSGRQGKGAMFLALFAP
jgi:hypothetical protein